jgi:hypothetical protein
MCYVAFTHFMYRSCCCVIFTWYTHLNRPCAAQCRSSCSIQNLTTMPHVEQYPRNVLYYQARSSSILSLYLFIYFYFAFLFPVSFLLWSYLSLSLLSHIISCFFFYPILFLFVLIFLSASTLFPPFLLSFDFASIFLPQCVTLYPLPTSKWLTNSVALVRERTITTEWPPLVGEVSANFCG